MQRGISRCKFKLPRTRLDRGGTKRQLAWPTALEWYSAPVINADSTAWRTPSGVANLIADLFTLYRASNVPPRNNGCAATGVNPAAAELVHRPCKVATTTHLMSVVSNMPHLHYGCTDTSVDSFFTSNFPTGGRVPMIILARCWTPVRQVMLEFTEH